MIDIETLKFIGVLNRLAEKSKHGIYPFADTNVTDAQFLNGIIYDNLSSDFAVIAKIDASNRTIVLTYNDIYLFQGIQIKACVRNNDTWVEVSFKNDSSCVLAIHDGEWHGLLS